MHSSSAVDLIVHRTYLVRGGPPLLAAGALQALQDRECNETEARQHWSFDTATLMFRHSGDSSRCIEFFPSHGAFGAWRCRDDLEANTRQQFRFEEDRFCLLADPTRCLQEATSHLLY